MALSRRRFVGWMVASGIGAMPRRTPAKGPAPRVVVVGGGYGGATAAKYVKVWAPHIDVTLVEREPRFVSGPLSNLVVGGSARIGDITLGYEGLRRHGVRVVMEEALAVDSVQRRVHLAGGATLGYERLIVAPGVDLVYDAIPGLRSPAARHRVPHAWKAGAQTLILRKQLEAMRDGGVYVLHIPWIPFSCPPAPYERACQVADYFKRAKPRSKLIVLDANPDIASRKALFLRAWNGPYKGMIDYRPNSEIEDVDVKRMAIKLVFDEVKGDVLNVVPPQRAGGIAMKSGLVTANRRWCGVEWRTCESVAVKRIHVLGDATLAAPAMSKSASMANQQARVCAAAVIALLEGGAVAEPVMHNACYSFVSGTEASPLTSVHRYDARQKTMLPVEGAGTVSDTTSKAGYAEGWAWARRIWADGFE